MSDFTITSPGRYKTAGGQLARIWRRPAGTPDAKTFPWQGTIGIGINSTPATWTDKGEYIRGSTSPRDIVEKLGEERATFL